MNFAVGRGVLESIIAAHDEVVAWLAVDANDGILCAVVVFVVDAGGNLGGQQSIADAMFDDFENGVVECVLGSAVQLDLQPIIVDAIPHEGNAAEFNLIVFELGVTKFASNGALFPVLVDIGEVSGVADSNGIHGNGGLGKVA